MFSGIIETQSEVLEVVKKDQAYGWIVKRPLVFDDIAVGHSLAMDGVCLTVESFTKETLAVTVGCETLKVTQWRMDNLKAHSFNMERSLRIGDRLHGHWVLGHVDTLSVLEEREERGECCVFKFSSPDPLLVWPKGSVAVNGVSLTINECQEKAFWVTAVPETLRRTNLGFLEEGDRVHVEWDALARAMFWTKRDSLRREPL